MKLHIPAELAKRPPNHITSAKETNKRCPVMFDDKLVP